MTQSLDFKQSGHLHAELLDSTIRTAGADKLIGKWRNTNTETLGIARIVIEQVGEDFTVSAAGMGAGGPLAWPLSQARVLANLEEEAGQRTVVLAATFDFGFMRTETHLRVNKGVLVIVLFNTFQDGSTRSSYVNREFFYRES